VDRAERTSTNEIGRVASYFSLGLANVLSGAWYDALEILERALAIGRERRLLVWEGGVLGVMAAAHLGLGDRAKALVLAEEAIAVSRRRVARFWEFSALLIRMRALRETQVSRRRERSKPRSPKPTPGSKCLARRATSPSSTSSAQSWPD
jgi:tetratricopeptide (TPR) repeat protein